MENEAMTAILDGQESVKTLKMLINGSDDSDPIVAVHLDNILRSFSLLSFLLHSPKFKSTAKGSLKKMNSRDAEGEGTVFHPVDSPTQIDEDGFSWRKYGQKTIKGSPYKRSYYRCVKHQNCHAKKQVQKIQDNPSLYRTIYIGQHLCQATIVLDPTNDNIQGSMSMIQFENQDQAMTDSNLPLLVSTKSNNPVIEDDLDFLLNPEQFWLPKLSTDFENDFDFNFS